MPTGHHSNPTNIQTRQTTLAMATTASSSSSTNGPPPPPPATIEEAGTPPPPPPPTVEEAGPQPEVHAPKFRPNIQLKRFTGEGALLWWKMLMKMVTFYKMVEEDILLLIPSYFDAGPLAWYHTLSENITSNIKLFEKSFLKRYSTVTNDFLDIDILNMTQTVNEKVEDYITRVLNKCLENNLDNDQLKISILMKGMKKQLAAIVMPSRPKSLDDLCELARVAEQTIVATSEPTNNAVTSMLFDMKAQLDSIQQEKSIAAMTPAPTSNEQPRRRQQPHQKPSYHHQQPQPHFQQPQYQSPAYRQPQPMTGTNPTARNTCTACGKCCYRGNSCSAFNLRCHYCNIFGHIKPACGYLIADRQQNGYNGSQGQNFQRRYNQNFQGQRQSFQQHQHYGQNRGPHQQANQPSSQGHINNQ